MGNLRNLKKTGREDEIRKKEQKETVLREG